MLGAFRRARDEWRPGAITLGEPIFPLFVLFGLNAADELDRTGFAVLLPDIRDHFGLADSTALAIVAAGVIAGLLVSIPLSFVADRRNRVQLATVGAAIWAVFSDPHVEPRATRRTYTAKYKVAILAEYDGLDKQAKGELSS